MSQHIIGFLGLAIGAAGVLFAVVAVIAAAMALFDEDT